MDRPPLFAVCFSVLCMLAVLWPVRENWRSQPRDSFPLSYYPMFSAKRKPVQRLPYVVGYDAQHRRHYIPANYLGSGGFNQVRRQLNRYVRQGAYTKALARPLRKLSRATAAPFNNLVCLDLVRGAYQLDGLYLSGQARPLSEEVLWSENILQP